MPTNLTTRTLRREGWLLGSGFWVPGSGMRRSDTGQHLPHHGPHLIHGYAAHAGVVTAPAPWRHVQIVAGAAVHLGSNHPGVGPDRTIGGWIGGAVERNGGYPQCGGEVQGTAVTPQEEAAAAQQRGQLG